ncbi:hypothetical protein [Salinibacter altiplanensis]|uniref:hypothetical protein n=1 Tax=Salinibacter altiplanensis TaxID=1803181 RepID=UPI000C9F06FC|nr:hypothetical protein [Salinibacter altiplanensis]
MAHDTTEIFVRDRSEDAVADWLRTVFEDLEQVAEAPIVTYEGQHDGEIVPVQVTERVKNGPYTSIWFNAPRLPWQGIQKCARAAHEALEAEVLCYLEQPKEPWRMLRVAEGETERVDERTLDDF